jgi:hypothetical protein
MVVAGMTPTINLELMDLVVDSRMRLGGPKSNARW